MKLTVEIARKFDGRLEARVMQGCRRGPNLLSTHRVMEVHDARIVAQTALAREMALGCTIEFTGESPDSDLKRAADQRLSTPRDRYGWRSL